MTAQKALIVSGGKVSQVPNTDSLLVGTGIDASVAGTLSIGTSTANAITIGQGGATPVTTTFPGPVQLNGTVTSVTTTEFVTNAQFDGNVTFGDAATDNISFVGQIDTAITQEGIAAPAVSPSGTGRIYFDSTSNTFKASQNGSPYVDLITTGAVTGSGTVSQIAYFNGSTSITSEGGVGPDALTWDASGNFLGVGTSTPAAEVDATKSVVGTVVATGTATGGTGSPSPGTLSDSAATWTVNQFKGYFVSITAGTGAGQTREIVSNTSTQLTIASGSVSSNWITVPNATSVYSITSPGSVSVQAKNTSTAAPAQSVVSAVGNAANVAATMIGFGSGNLGASWGGGPNKTSVAHANAAVFTTGTAASAMLIGPRGSTAKLSIGTGLDNVNGTRALLIESNGGGSGTGVTFNPDSNQNIDFIVKTKNAPDMIRVLSSTNRVGINNSSPSDILDVFGNVRIKNIDPPEGGSPSTRALAVQTLAGVSVLEVDTTTTDRLKIFGGRIAVEEVALPAGVPSAEGTAGRGKLMAGDGTNNARPYWIDDTGLVLNMTMDRFVDLGTTAAVAIDADPKLPVFRTVTLNGNATFTTSNLGNGRSVSVRVICDASTRTLTFPAGWTWLGSGAPASLAASGVGYLSITDYGAADANVVAAWSYNNQPVAVTGSGVDNQIAVWSGTNTQDGSAALTFNGTTLGVTGGITQTGGAVSLTGNAASSLTTSSGALTLTSAAAATWSTAAGDLNLTATTNSVVVTGAEAAVDAITLTASNAAGGIDVNAGTGGVTVDTTALFSIDGATSSNVTVTGSGQSLTLSAAGGGAQRVLVQSAGTGVNAVDLVATAGGFSIDGVAASNVTTTGANLTLSTITSGAVNLTAAQNLEISANGNATTWPTAAGTSGQVLTNSGAGTLSGATPSTSASTIDIPATANEPLLAGDLVSFIYSTTARVQKADANDTLRETPVGFVTAAAAGAGSSTTLRVAGIATVPTSNFTTTAPTTANVGQPIYMSETPGQVTLAAPSTGPTVAQKVGVIYDVSGGNASVLIQIGDPIVIP